MGSTPFVMKFSRMEIPETPPGAKFEAEAKVTIPMPYRMLPKIS